ncbi:probable sodium/metabolite cotransporter BASS4, chloroplastic [Tanacetum coccineum]
MSTYLKNMAEYKHNQLKSKSNDEIQKMFDKEMKRVNIFVDIDTELVKGSETKAEESSSKRAGTKLEPEVVKKQKVDDEAEVDDDQEEVEMKRHMEIVINEEEVAVDAIPLATKPPVIVEYKIVKEGRIGYFQIVRADRSSKRNIRPEEEYERVLWGDLKVMFKPDVESEVWRSLKGHNVTVWKLFDSRGVHFFLENKEIVKEVVVGGGEARGDDDDESNKVISVLKDGGGEFDDSLDEINLGLSEELVIRVLEGRDRKAEEGCCVMSKATGGEKGKNSVGCGNGRRDCTLFGASVFTLFNPGPDIGETTKVCPVGLFGLVSILLLIPLLSRIMVNIHLPPQEFVTGLSLYNCMPTSKLSGVALTKLARGNSALALAITELSNLLGILIVHYSVSKIIRGGVGASVPADNLFKSLIVTVLIPLIMGTVL